MKNRILRLLVLPACCIQIYLMTSCLGRTTGKVVELSPSGKYKAELIEADTGAAGGWMSAVRVAQTAPSVWDSVSGGAKATVFGVDLRSSHVRFIWKDNNHLEITCDECDSSKIDLQKASWKDVRVSYEFKGTGSQNR